MKGTIYRKSHYSAESFSIWSNCFSLTVLLSFSYHYDNASTKIWRQLAMGTYVYIGKKDKILTHFCFKLPPFDVAQINNCNAQGKVTQKIKRRSHVSEYQYNT